MDITFQSPLTDKYNLKSIKSIVSAAAPLSADIEEVKMLTTCDSPKGYCQETWCQHEASLWHDRAVSCESYHTSRGCEKRQHWGPRCQLCSQGGRPARSQEDSQSWTGG